MAHIQIANGGSILNLPAVILFANLGIWNSRQNLTQNAMLQVNQSDHHSMFYTHSWC